MLFGMNAGEFALLILVFLGCRRLFGWISRTFQMVTYHARRLCEITQSVERLTEEIRFQHNARTMPARSSSFDWTSLIQTYIQVVLSLLNNGNGQNSISNLFSNLFRRTSVTSPVTTPVTTPVSPSHSNSEQKRKISVTPWMESSIQPDTNFLGDSSRPIDNSRRNCPWINCPVANNLSPRTNEPKINCPESKINCPIMNVDKKLDDIIENSLNMIGDQEKIKELFKNSFNLVNNMFKPSEKLSEKSSEKSSEKTDNINNFSVNDVLNTNMVNDKLNEGFKDGMVMLENLAASLERLETSNESCKNLRNTINIIKELRASNTMDFKLEGNNLLLKIDINKVTELMLNRANPFTNIEVKPEDKLDLDLELPTNNTTTSS